jgi:hypothetical protein
MSEIVWLQSCFESVWCVALFTPWAIPFLGLWACRPANRKWMLAMVPVPAVAFYLGSRSELMSAYTLPSALAVLGPLALVAGENWRWLRGKAWFWTCTLLAGFLSVFAALSALVGEASANRNDQYCIGGPAPDCRLDYGRLADVFFGYWAFDVVLGGGYLAIAGLLAAGVARHRRRRMGAGRAPGPAS